MTTRKSKSSGLFRKSGNDGTKTSGALTSERITRDLAAFKSAGGKIEVLGVTRVLTKVEPAEKKKGSE